MDPEHTGEEEDLEIFFKNTRPGVDPPRFPSPSLLEPPVSPGELDYGVVLDQSVTGYSGTIRNVTVPLETSQS